jgi:hypothetical protein
MAETHTRVDRDIGLPSKHLTQRAISGHGGERRAALTLLPEAIVARQLGVSLSTLRVWRRRGEGPRHAKLGRLVRYRPDDVLTFLEEHSSTRTET